jgi:hypothetical protein
VSGWIIEGVVRGFVKFPDHPDHEGALGLVGGEDVMASRRFRSVGEAMTWCRKVLNEQVTPRKIAAWGDLLEPRTEPGWHEAEVVASNPWHYDVDDLRWSTDGCDWREVMSGGHYGKVVRTDPRPTDQP